MGAPQSDFAESARSQFAKEKGRGDIEVERALYGGNYDEYLARKGKERNATAELLKGAAEVGKVFTPVVWKIIGWVLIAIFLIGPGLAATLAIFTAFPWWLWLGGMFLAILYLTDRRRS